MVCILCGKSGLRSALTFPCDEHYVCKPCVDRSVTPYTDADAERWLDPTRTRPDWQAPARRGEWVS